MVAPSSSAFLSGLLTTFKMGYIRRDNDREPLLATQQEHQEESLYEEEEDLDTFMDDLDEFIERHDDLSECEIEAFVDGLSTEEHAIYQLRMILRDQQRHWATMEPLVKSMDAFVEAVEKWDINPVIFDTRRRRRERERLSDLDSNQPPAEEAEEEEEPYDDAFIDSI